MGREEKEKILILKTYKVGETHRGVKLLTPMNGVISALVYGGNGKNSFKKGSIIPFCFGLGELVHSGDRYQLKEFSLELAFDGIRENLNKMYMASLWAEIIMSSYGGGQQGADLFALVLDSLLLLENGSCEDDFDRVMVRFLWMYLSLSGERPDPVSCFRCGSTLSSQIYRDKRGLLYCHSCSFSDMDRFPPGIISYLARIDETDGREFIKIGLSRETMKQLKKWLYAVIQDHMEYPLKTLKTGETLFLL
jgi:DNA repair protein RecO (recombination protein O)